MLESSGKLNLNKTQNEKMASFKFTILLIVIVCSNISIITNQRKIDLIFLEMHNDQQKTNSLLIKMDLAHLNQTLDIMEQMELQRAAISDKKIKDINQAKHKLNAYMKLYSLMPEKSTS